MNTFAKYENNKIFITLSSLLILFILIIIRECEYPLLFDVPLFNILFKSYQSDKLFYNISISYIAAYIFYIVQIYIPFTLKNRNAINILRPIIIKEINYLKYALCILDASTFSKNEDLHIKSDLSCPLYISIRKENFYYLRRFSYGNTLTQLKNSILNTNNNICNNYCLHELDPYIATLLTNTPIDTLFSILDRIDQNIHSKDVYIFSNTNIIEIQQYISKLEHILRFTSSCTCTVNNDVIQHSTYDTALLNSQQDEFFFTINIADNIFRL